jgi:hypothetical protein
METTNYNDTTMQYVYQKHIFLANQNLKRSSEDMPAKEEKYGTQVKVVFHDVWTEEGKPFADRYNLDKNSKEFFRYEGFFEVAELVKVLEVKGVNL